MEPWKDFDFDDDVDSGSSGSAAVPPTSGGAGLKGAAVAYVMAEDADALDCGICCLPLKPPIFQCNVGHVVCSPCHNKLMGTGKCHLCGINVAGGYRRCHAMERLVESIRVPCPNATDGCTAMPAYCHQQSHRQACPHAPYSCPGKNCGFIGYMNAGLLDHFSGTHGWPCTTKKNRANKTCRFSVGLNNGFNFLIADLATAGEGGSATITSSKYLFLLNVLQKPLGRAISVLLIGRKPSSKAVKCVLTFSHIASEDRKFLGSHLLQSKINVECSEICSGVPNPDDCFQFVVPDYLWSG